MTTPVPPRWEALFPLCTAGRACRLLLVVGVLAGPGCVHPGLGFSLPQVPDGVAPLKPPSHGECPPFSPGGVHRFRSGGFQREVLILAPPSPTVGAPAVVVYHGLGSQPETMVPRLRLEELAGRGVVVVLPRAHRDARLGWGLGPGGVADITLWEDLRTCLVARAGVDPARITISGFSAGALWSTLTLLHGARTVAAAVLYSGGLLPPFVEYRRPEWPLPVVALHGGDGDRYHKGPWDVRFQPGSEALAAALVRDGSAVRICDHGFGHRLPPAWAGVLHAVVLQARGGSPIDLGPPPSACRDLVPDGTGAPEGP